MNKKTLMISMTLFAVSMLAAPVLAKGPMNAAGKNPNLVFEYTMYGSPVADLRLPSGVTNRWFGDEAHIVVKYADKFNCPTEVDLGNAWWDGILIAENRGIWVHMNKGDYTLGTGYLGLFTFFGLTPPTDVPPEGVYIWGSKLKTQ